MTFMLHDKKEINVTGIHTNKNHKPVFCIDTGEVFASVSDAAEAYGVHITAISCAALGKTKTCQGKRFCFVSRLADHTDEIAEVVRAHMTNANKYNALMAEQERIRKIHETHEKRKAEYLKAYKAYEQAKELLAESEVEIKALEGVIN